MERLNSRFELAEERINILENRLLEIMQAQEQRKKNGAKKKRNRTQKWGTPLAQPRMWKVLEEKNERKTIQRNKIKNFPELI